MALRRHGGYGGDFSGHRGGYGDDDWGLQQWHRPSSMLDQMFNFPESMLEFPSNWLGDEVIGARQLATTDQLGRLTQMINTGHRFAIDLDVSGFRPEELNVKTVRDRILVVQGRHGEQRATEEGGRGFVRREFTRSFMLPRGVNSNILKTNLAPDGTLHIEAPKQEVAAVSHERTIPIEYTK